MLENYHTLKSLAWKYRHHWNWGGHYQWTLRVNGVLLLELWIANGWPFLKSYTGSNAKYHISLNIIERYLAWSFLKRMQRLIINEQENI